MSHTATLWISLALLVCISTHVMNASANCTSATYCDIELFLAVTGDHNQHWPGTGQTNVTFLEQLAASTGVDASVFTNLTRIFDTLVLGVLSVTESPTAASMADTIITSITSCSTPSVQSLCTTFSITGGIVGYVPVEVPADLRISDEPDQSVFAILGGVAAVLVVLQFAYGYYHFSGFGFITAAKDERD